MVTKPHASHFDIDEWHPVRMCIHIKQPVAVKRETNNKTIDIPNIFCYSLMFNSDDIHLKLNSDCDENNRHMNTE